MEGWQQAGEHLAAAIQALKHVDVDLDGAVLTGFVVVAEYQRPDGRRIMGEVTRDVVGQELTPWAALGLLHAAVTDFEIKHAEARLPRDADER